MIQPTDLCAPSKPEEKTTLDRPIEHLVACHRRIEERLATLERVIPHWDTKRDEALTAVRNCLRFFDTNGVMHTEDEERSLFPRLDPLMNENEKAYVAELAEQHVVVEEAYQELKKAFATIENAAAPTDMREFAPAVANVSKLYRDHIAYEESRLGGMSKRLLDASAMQQIAAEMKQRRNLIK